MKAQKILTPQQVRADWARHGKTMAGWARDHGFDKATVCQVMNGRNAASTGVGHRIAVALGIKDGVVSE